MPIKLDEHSLRTDDLCFATLLSMKGYTTAMELRERGQSRRIVWWTLDETDDELRDIVQEYAANKCRVEPREFLRHMRGVRRAMYDLLGVGRTSS
jgi:hypothetical protein